jgi:O-antigen/teichoic acid export membrane protein
MRLQKLIYQGIVWRGLYYASVFVLNIIIARVFRAVDSGVINYVINNLSFLLLVTSFSLESALSYFASKNEIALNKLTGISVLFAISGALLSMVIGTLFMLSQEERTLTFSLFQFTYVLGVVLTNYFSSLYYARNNPVLPNAIMVVVNLFVL